jgi:RNA polymerase sigma factor FliA
MKEVVALWRKYKKTKDPMLREQIVEKYLYLVKYVAGRTAINLPSNIDLGDLVSYGILGLFDAIEKYDVEQGNKFETYAVSRVRGSIMDELRKLDWAPRLLRKKAREVEKKNKELEEELGRLATDDELAKALNVSLKDLNTMYSELSCTTFLSLDEVWENQSGNKSVTRMQSIEDTAVESQLDILQKEESKEIIAKAIKELPEKEALVMVLYYYENLTLREIGQVLNVTESRVCQIHTKVILRLRSILKRMTGGVPLQI